MISAWWLGLLIPLAALGCFYLVVLVGTAIAVMIPDSCCVKKRSPRPLARREGEDGVLE